jgi:C1A family cysteine protease
MSFALMRLVLVFSRAIKTQFCGILTTLAIFGLLQQSEATELKGRGLKALSQEDIQHIEQHAHWITKVHPNKIGAARIHHHLKKQGKDPIELKIAHAHEEIIAQKGLPSETHEHFQAALGNPLPSAVDNSTLPSFPPIGDQGQIGSCVAWGSTYYQATHEYGLLNGINNKTSTTHVLSPKWTYNLLNSGRDNGLNPNDAFTLLSQNGATTLTNFPYDTNYLAWDLNPQDWVSAISYRMGPVQMLTGIGGGQPQNLQTIKQLLNNGHILTFATFVDSWVYTTVKNDPTNPNSPAVGQQAVSWMNGTSGGHFITIVGYNDDVWIDVNGNNKVDSGEKGAFLIANSWSTSWGNNGFIWISYDAFLASSAVTGGPSKNRVPLAEAMSSYVASVVPKAPNYSPKLVAQFTLTQNMRNQISIGGGISNSNQTSPSQTFASGAIVNQGGPFEFNGNYPLGIASGTFSLDLSDLIPTPSTSSTSERFYLLLGDSKLLHPTTLTAFSLLDQVHQIETHYTQVPLVCDHQNLTPHIDYDFFAGHVDEDSAPTVNITSPTDEATLEGTVNVAANVTSTLGISKVEFYVDSVLYITDSNSPYLATIDTTLLSDGPHEFKAVAYDTSNNTAQSTIAVTVQNTAPVIAVNSGGNNVNYQDLTWAKDNGFTTPSGVYSNPLNFENPIYQSERNGTFSYNFTVNNGSQTVTLKFAELRYRVPGRRIFNVIINGNTVISNLDLVKAAGYGIPYDRSFTVNVTNQQIKIDFIPVVNKAKVNGIEITSN